MTNIKEILHKIYDLLCSLRKNLDLIKAKTIEKINLSGNVKRIVYKFYKLVYRLRQRLGLIRDKIKEKVNLTVKIKKTVNKLHNKYLLLRKSFDLIKSKIRAKVAKPKIKKENLKIEIQTEEKVAPILEQIRDIVSPNILKQEIIKILMIKSDGLTFNELLYSLAVKSNELHENIRELISEDKIVNRRGLYLMKNSKPHIIG